MTDKRTHRAVSADGTEITAAVQGQGPPLVLLPAGPGDCEATWRPVLPHLRERFTCYLLDTRGRGASADHPDHSPDRLVEDITALIDSVGEPVGLAEWGSFVGGALAFAAVHATPAVRAVATYDPLVFEIAGEEDNARINGVLDRVGALAGEGRLAEAAAHFVEGLASHGYYTEEDMVDGAPTSFWSASAANIPMFMHELEQAEQASGPGPSDPGVLADVTVPVLVLHGGRSHPMNIDCARHVADHVPDAELRAVAGAGHYGPHTHPQAVAEELVAFFATARVTA